MSNIISKTIADKEYVNESVNTKVTNPSVAVVGQVLQVETVDENGKPLTYVAADIGGSSKVAQSPVSDDKEYPLLLAGAGQIEETSSGQTYFDSGITVNPSTNTINANATSCCGYKLKKVMTAPDEPEANTIYIVI